MKRLVGGDFLLDLTPLTIEESVDVETYTNITNEDVLKQLTNLKKFIPNPQMIKPIWVKLVNGDLDELVVVRGQLSVLDSKTFEIIIPISGYKLSILIEFTQVLNDDNEPIDDWYIDTNDAKYLFISDTQNVKEIIEDENFGDVSFAGDISITGDLEVTGDVKVFENIVDKDGHKRFIEGDITIKDTQSDVEKIYGKWSLSGSHLLIVLAGNIANTKSINAGELAKIEIPDWILDKIQPIFLENVALTNFSLYNIDYTSQIHTFVLSKGQYLYIRLASSFTATADRSFRISFDLLIDNE